MDFFDNELQEEYKHHVAPLILTHAYVQGSIVEIKLELDWQTRPHGKRGMVKDFSPRARLAMIKYFQRIDFWSGYRPLFITLTYPDELALPSYDERILHRKIMARHLERIAGRNVPASWRIEWMPRKSGALIGVPCPHWHLMIFGHRFIDCKAVNAAWCKTIGWEGYCRTETKRVYNEAGIQLYMAKYISKEAIPLSLVIPTIQSKLGNQYGWLRKREIPLHPLHAHRYLTEAQADRLRELACEMKVYVHPDVPTSYSLFGAVAQDVHKILDGKPLTENQ